LVSDARGIIFIANQPGWRYRSFAPLSDQDRKLGSYSSIRQTAPGASEFGSPSHLRRQQCHLTTGRGPDGSADYLWQSLPLAPKAGPCICCASPQPAFEDIRNAALAAAGMWLTLVFLCLFLYQRWRLAKHAPTQPRRT
jgi:two-component system C4-dicarboxylate transport sensor histidine kinase DctB